MYLRDNKCSLCKYIYIFNKHLETKYSLHAVNHLSQFFCPIVAHASVLLLNNQPIYNADSISHAVLLSATRCPKWPAKRCEYTHLLLSQWLSQWVSGDLLCYITPLNYFIILTIRE
jgi:hypothetical protein